MTNIKPKQGDRIIINNIPTDYQFKDLYLQKDTGIYIGVVDSSDELRANIPFFTGYVPYKVGNNYECSGCGHSIDRTKLKYVKTDLAVFWRFINDEARANNSELYYEPANYFECDFTDINGNERFKVKQENIPLTSRSTRRQIRLDKAAKTHARNTKRGNTVRYY